MHGANFWWVCRGIPSIESAKQSIAIDFWYGEVKCKISKKMLGGEEEYFHQLTMQSPKVNYSVWDHPLVLWATHRCKEDGKNITQCKGSSNAASLKGQTYYAIDH